MANWRAAVDDGGSVLVCLSCGTAESESEVVLDQKADWLLAVGSMVSDASEDNIAIGVSTVSKEE